MKSWKFMEPNFCKLQIFTGSCIHKSLYFAFMLNKSRMFKKLSKMPISEWEGGGNEIHGNGSATTNGNDSRIGTAYHTFGQCDMSS